ncbi:MAG: hypothetical protein ABJN69_14725 [Hellea sp.]
MSITSKTFLALILAAALGGGVLYSNHAQSQDRTNGQSAEQIYPVSVPIKFESAEIRNVPGRFMLGLAENVSKEAGNRNMDIVDVSFAVNGKAADALAPSLQPRLFIGGDVYNVQRVEYENWDTRKERAVDKSKPVRETHYYHFFLPLDRAEEIRSSDATFLTTLEKAEIMTKTQGKVTQRSLRKIDQNLSRHAIRLDAKALMSAGK